MLTEEVTHATKNRNEAPKVGTLSATTIQSPSKEQAIC